MPTNPPSPPTGNEVPKTVVVKKPRKKVKK